MESETLVVVGCEIGATSESTGSIRTFKSRGFSSSERFLGPSTGA